MTTQNPDLTVHEGAAPAPNRWAAVMGVAVAQTAIATDREAELFEKRSAAAKAAAETRRMQTEAAREAQVLLDAQKAAEAKGPVKRKPKRKPAARQASFLRRKSRGRFDEAGLKTKMAHFEAGLNELAASDKDGAHDAFCAQERRIRDDLAAGVRIAKILKTYPVGVDGVWAVIRLTGLKPSKKNLLAMSADEFPGGVVPKRVLNMKHVAGVSGGVAEDYLRGRPVAEIKAAYQITHYKMLKLIRDQGIKIRSCGARKVPVYEIESIPPKVRKDIVADYQAYVDIRTILRIRKISRAILKLLLAERGVKYRTKRGRLILAHQQRAAQRIKAVLSLSGAADA